MKQEAKQRVFSQLEGIKEYKEKQKEVFHRQIENEEQNFRMQENMRKINNIENLMYIQMQIDQKKAKD